MDISIQTALIGFIGGLASGLLTGYYQKLNLKTSIKAEFEKLLIQHRNAIQLELINEKTRNLVKGVSIIMSITDLEVNRNMNFAQIVKAINEVELYLNPVNPLESNIMKALHDIAEASRDVVNHDVHQESLLKYQGNLVSAVQKFINNPS